MICRLRCHCAKNPPSLSGHLYSSWRLFLHATYRPRRPPMFSLGFVTGTVVGVGVSSIIFVIAAVSRRQ